MQIKSFIFGLFQTNMYVVTDAQGRTLLIDPACSCVAEREALSRYLKENSLHVDAILATHGHLDHLWGAAWASREWHMPVQIHPADRPMVEAMQQQYDLFGVPMQAEPFPIENLNSKIKNQKSPMSTFQVLETPGHTPGSVCFYWPQEKVLFSGDTLFRMGYGRTDLPGGSTAQLIDSLERLFTLPADTVVWPGHGERTTIGAERR